MGKTVTNSFNGGKLAAKDYIDGIILLMKNNLTPGGCLPLSRDYIHVYNHYYQTSSSLKLLGQSKQNFIWSLLGKWERKLYKWYRSHDQDGHHAHLWQKPSKLFYRTNGPMIMKLCMEQYVLKLYKVYINDDH